MDFYVRRQPRPKGYKNGVEFNLTEYEKEVILANRKKEREEAQKAVFLMKQFEEQQKKVKESKKLSPLDCFALMLLSTLFGGFMVHYLAISYFASIAPK